MNAHTVIQGTAYNASVHYPTADKFTKLLQYQIVISITNQEVKWLSGVDPVAAGLVREDHKRIYGGGPYLIIKMPICSRTGCSNKSPQVLDALRKPETRRVGDGSLVNILVRSFETSYGNGLHLDAVQVVKLVPPRSFKEKYINNVAG